MAAPKGNTGQEWHSGLCSCFDDCGSCCLGFWCPSALYGYNVEKIEGGSCFGSCCAFLALQILCGCVCCISGPTRTNLRAKYGLRETPCNDCCIHFWCVPCALCQESREAKYRLALAPPAGTYVTTAAPVVQQM